MAKSLKKAAIIKKVIGKCKENKEGAAHEKGENSKEEKAENMGKKFGNLMKAVKK